MRIGITGSIACGKSTVAEYLRSQGYIVVDADRISHELTGPGGRALPAIQMAFPDCIMEDGTLNRSMLAACVFSHPESKLRLEQILHPMIFDEIDQQMNQVPSNQIVFADIPLLFECQMEQRFDEVWVVTLDPEKQLERLMARDHMTREDAESRIRSQMPQSEKVARATRCIPTDGEPEETVRIIAACLAAVKTVQAVTPKRRIRTLPIETVASTETPLEQKVRVQRTEVPHAKKTTHPVDAFMNRIPVPVRRVVFIVLLLGLITSTFFAARTYIEHQAEQNRLAAEAAERAQHPLYYGDLIIAYSARQELDPALVSAVILCESSYDSNAQSRLGARGLMQLMEDTAGWIAHKLGEDNAAYSFDLLYDPETNIRFGTWYLGFLSRRYGGDAKKVVCAYHAGQGNVDAWLKNPEYSQDGVSLTTIPTKDTATYAGRVLRARDIYEKYYFPKPAEESLTEER